MKPNADKWRIAAVLMLLLPCAVMAAPPAAGRGGSTLAGRPQLGQPVTPISINVDVRNLPVTKPWRPGQPLREAHRRQFQPIGAKLPHAPASKRTLPDRLPELQQIWDSSAPGSRAKARAKAFSRDRVSIDNIDAHNISTGDPVVEVGANHVVYAVNGSPTSFTIYSKSGAKIAGPTAIGSLAPSGNACATDKGDPLVHYDRQANRWFLLSMDSDALCIFISKTSDPVSGGWWLYSQKSVSGDTPDYPHCGVWNNAYVCGANETQTTGAEIYVFDRERMLTGATARPAQVLRSVSQLPGYGFQILTPSTAYGTAVPPAGRKQLLARHRDDEAHDGSAASGTQDYLELYELNLDWATPANTRIVTLPKIAIAEFNSWFRDYSTFATVPQPGSSSRLDPIREVLLNQLVYRNMGTHEAVVGTFATNQNPARSGSVVDSAVRWFELRRVGTGEWTLHQEGTFSPGDSNTHHLMGTAAMDKFGNIGMAYNVTKTSTPAKYPSLLYTGRTPTDPLGVMSLGEVEVATGTGPQTSGRWGDYYQITVDPVDDCTFWFVGMYRPSGTAWHTRIADFKFPACGGTTPPPPTGPSGSNDTDVAITDNGAAVTSAIAISGLSGTTTSTSSAYVKITHPWRGDLEIKLKAPDGTVGTLQAIVNANDDADNIDKLYALPSNLQGKSKNGTWTLQVRDAAPSDIGTLTFWSITL